MANERFVTIENRIFNANEGRTTITGGVEWMSRTLHTIGSANVKDIFLILDGYTKPAGTAETNLPNAFTITECYVEVVGNPPAQVLFGGSKLSDQGRRNSKLLGYKGICSINRHCTFCV